MSRRTGTDILRDIDQEGAKIRSNIQRLNQLISKSNNALEDMRGDQALAYQELAKVRFDLLQDDSVAAKLTSAEREAKNYLSGRQKARSELDAELAKNQTAQKELEDRRHKLLGKIDDFAAKVKIAEEKTLDKLEEDETFQGLIETLEKTEAQIPRIENKIVLAKEDYEEKVVPYHNDPLFMYLWECSYGTSSYKAGHIRRVMDRWVANVCRFEPARRNYAMLSAIPEKLETHKELLQQKIKTLNEDIVAYEQSSFEKDGVKKLQQDLSNKQSELQKIDLELDQLEGAHHKILQDKEKFSGNSDQFYSGAMQELQVLYQGKSLHNLRRYAAATPTREDDNIIQTLYNLDQKIETEDNHLSEYQSSLRQEEFRLIEVQNARKKFKEQKYDSRDTTFRDGNLFSVLLGQLVTGIITNKYFWSAVGRLCLEVLDEMDILDIDADDFFERPRRSSYYRKSRGRSRSRKSSRRRRD